MTLESYNDANLRTMRTASALGMAAGSVFLGVAVLCAVKTALSVKRERKSKGRTKRRKTMSKKSDEEKKKKVFQIPLCRQRNGSRIHDSGSDFGRGLRL